MIVSSGFLLNNLKADNATFGTAFGTPDNANVKLILNFVILTVLLIATLTVSKKMGCQVGSFVQEWGKSIKKKAQGYAGKVIKRGGQRVVGAAAEGMLKNEKVMAIANRIPLATRGLARASSWQEKQKAEKKKEYEKTYKGYSNAGLAAMAKREKFGATEIGLETVGQGPRITEDKKKVLQGIIDKKREDDKKKDLVKEENKRLEEIKSELEKIEAKMPGITTDKREEYETKIVEKDSDIMKYQGDKSDEATKMRTGFLIEKDKMEKTLKKIDNFNKEMKEIREKKEKRREAEGLEERIGKIEKSAQEKAGAKPEEKKEEKAA